MKKQLACLFLIWVLRMAAQQTPLYIQNIFNKAGVNPAAAGTDINQPYNYVFGINRQWVGFSNPPRTNFVNFSMTIRPPRSYHYWQNVGVYLDNEASGVSSNIGLYANYTLHLLVRKNWVASFGAYVGARMFYLSTGSLDRGDPAVQASSGRSLMYPDIIPGFRLSNRKIFFDVSARNVSINRIKDFNGHKFGDPPSQLKPELYLGIGRRFLLNDYFMLMPSLALNTAIVHAPNVDLTVMLYYINHMGAGLALRNNSLFSAIYQVRLLRDLTVGLAYSYSLNMARYAATNSFEIMVGVVPFGMTGGGTGRHSVARCPNLDY